MPKQSRPEHAHRKSEHQEQGGAPGWPRRQPRRREKRPDRATPPSALFFAIERVFEACATAREQCCIRFDLMRGQECEQFLLAIKRFRAPSAMREVDGQASLLGRADFFAARNQYQQRLPFAARLVRRLPAILVVDAPLHSLGSLFTGCHPGSPAVSGSLETTNS